MMSDGLLERGNPAGEELGYLRVESLLMKVADRQPDEIIQQLI